MCSLVIVEPLPFNSCEFKVHYISQNFYVAATLPNEAKARTPNESITTMKQSYSSDDLSQLASHSLKRQKPDQPSPPFDDGQFSFGSFSSDSLGLLGSDSPSSDDMTTGNLLPPARRALPPLSNPIQVQNGELVAVLKEISHVYNQQQADLSRCSMEFNKLIHRAQLLTQPPDAAGVLSRPMLSSWGATHTSPFLGGQVGLRSRNGFACATSKEIFKDAFLEMGEINKFNENTTHSAYSNVSAESVFLDMAGQEHTADSSPKNTASTETPPTYSTVVAETFSEHRSQPDSGFHQMNFDSKKPSTIRKFVDIVMPEVTTAHDKLSLQEQDLGMKYYSKGRLAMLFLFFLLMFVAAMFLHHVYMKIYLQTACKTPTKLTPVDVFGLRDPSVILSDGVTTSANQVLAAVCSEKLNDLQRSSFYQDEFKTEVTVVGHTMFLEGAVAADKTYMVFATEPSNPFVEAEVSHEDPFRASLKACILLLDNYY